MSNPAGKTNARATEEVNHAYEDVKSLVAGAYELGFHEMGYEPEKVLWAEIERLRALEASVQTYLDYTHRLEARVQMLERENGAISEALLSKMGLSLQDIVEVQNDR